MQRIVSWCLTVCLAVSGLLAWFYYQQVNSMRQMIWREWFTSYTYLFYTELPDLHHGIADLVSRDTVIKQDLELFISRHFRSAGNIRRTSEEISRLYPKAPRPATDLAFYLDHIERDIREITFTLSPSVPTPLSAQQRDKLRGHLETLKQLVDTVPTGFPQESVWNANKPVWADAQWLPAMNQLNRIVNMAAGN